MTYEEIDLSLYQIQSKFKDEFPRMNLRFTSASGFSEVNIRGMQGFHYDLDPRGCVLFEQSASPFRGDLIHFSTDLGKVNSVSIEKYSFEIQCEHWTLTGKLNSTSDRVERKSHKFIPEPFSFLELA